MDKTTSHKLYLEVTNKELVEIEQALKVLDSKREMVRKSTQKKNEREGKSPTSRKGHRKQPITLKIVQPSDIVLEHYGYIPGISKPQSIPNVNSR